MHIEEISDEVAERLKVSQAQSDESKSQGEEEEEITQLSSTSQSKQNATENAPSTASAAVFPELSPGRAMTEKKTVDEVVAELKKTPFFMTELEENDDTEAFKALAYEGTPLEVATDFKDHGNECFRVKRWADAKEFYTKGVLVLATEERKRAKGGEQKDSHQVEEEKNVTKEEGKKEEDDVQSQRAMLESLYVNRAACHLELKNYRSCWLDCSAALRLNDTNIKAYYRSARAFLAVGRIEEADDACARGLALDENNNPLKAVARDIIKKSEETAVKQKKENERLLREKRRERLLKVALAGRGIKTRTTAQPPEMEDAGLKLVPDPEDPKSTLSFPAVLLYPAHLKSDFIKAFNETESLADHLTYIFPLPWDESREYTVAGVECYMETITGGLVKVGKKASLLKTLIMGNVEVVDELVRFFVLPKAKAPAWIQEFKTKKAAEKAGG